MDKNWKISQIGFAQSKQLWKSKSLALTLLPTENQIFMACLDAHLYEIEYIICFKIKNPPLVELCWQKKRNP
jgi:hypothetical protein